MMDGQMIKTYIIDEITTPNPFIINLLKILNTQPIFVKIIATKLHPKQQDYVQILAKQNMHKKYTLNNTIQQKLNNCVQLLKGIGILHQLECTIGNQQFSQFIAYSEKQKGYKILAYRCRQISNLLSEKSEQNSKEKDKNLSNILKFGIEHFLPKIGEKEQSKQQQQNYIKIDIWKWSCFTLQTLYEDKSEIVKKVIQKIVTAKQRLKEEQILLMFSKQLPVFTKLLKYDQKIVDQCLNVLKKCLIPFPNNRPTIQEIVKVLQKLLKIIQNFHQNLNFQEIKKFKEMQKQILEKREQSKIQIPQDQQLILTTGIKKKLNTIFQKNLNKTVKQYKAVYRATKFKFQPNLFYSQCSKKNSLLFCIDTVQNGVILAYIAPQIYLNESNGIQGCYIADEKLQSFIYSNKNQEIYKLLTKQKAYLSSPVYGPIIGDRDIVLGNHPHSNYCYFPKSYEPSKKKELIANTKLTNNKFSIKNYDVYEIIFKK